MHFCTHLFLVYYMIFFTRIVCTEIATVVISIPISFLLVIKDDNILKWFMFGLANLVFLFTRSSVVHSSAFFFLLAFWSEPYICTCRRSCSRWRDGCSCILIFRIHYWLQAFTFLQILQNKLNEDYWLRRHDYRLLCNRCPIHCRYYCNKFCHQNCSLDCCFCHHTIDHWGIVDFRRMMK